MKQFLILTVIYLLSVSCSKEIVGNVSGPDEQPIDINGSIISFSPIPTYVSSNQLNISLSSMNDTNKRISGIDFYINNFECENAPDLFLSRGDLLSNNSPLILYFNTENNLVYKVLFEDQSESECTYLKTIIHDNVLPPNPISSVGHIKTNEESIHFDLSGGNSDVFQIEFHKDLIGLTPQLISSALWFSGGGHLGLSLNQDSNYYIRFRDRAGNVSASPLVLRIDHNNIGPDKPNVSGLSQGQSVVYSPDLLIKGSVGAHVTQINIMRGLSDTLVATMNPTEFSTGTQISLDLGPNLIKLASVDEYGNYSELYIATIYYVETASKTIDILNKDFEQEGPIQKLALTRFQIQIFNQSKESSLMLPIKVDSVSLSSLPPELTPVNAGCLVEILPPNGLCNITFDANFSTTGEKSLNFNIILDGVTVPVSLSLEVTETLIVQEKEDEGALSTFIGISPNGNFFVFSNGLLSVNLDSPLFANDTSSYNGAFHDIASINAGILNGKLFYLDNQTGAFNEIATIKTYTNERILSFNGDTFLIDNLDGTYDFINIYGLTLNMVVTQDPPISYKGSFYYSQLGQFVKINSDLNSEIIVNSGVSSSPIIDNGHISYLKSSGGNFSIEKYDGETFSEEVVPLSVLSAERVSEYALILNTISDKNIYSSGILTGYVDPSYSSSDFILYSHQDKSVLILPLWLDGQNKSLIVKIDSETLETESSILEPLVTDSNFKGYFFGKDREAILLQNSQDLDIYSTSEFRESPFSLMGTINNKVPTAFLGLDYSFFITELDGVIQKFTLDEFGLSSVFNFYSPLSYLTGPNMKFVDSAGPDFTIYYQDSLNQSNFEKIRSFE